MSSKHQPTAILILGDMSYCSWVTAPEEEELQQIVLGNQKTDGNIESEADVPRRKAAGRYLMEDFPTRDAYHPEQYQYKCCKQSQIHIHPSIHTTGIASFQKSFLFAWELNYCFLLPPLDAPCLWGRIQCRKGWDMNLQTETARQRLKENAVNITDEFGHFC